MFLKPLFSPYPVIGLHGRRKIRRSASTAVDENWEYALKEAPERKQWLELLKKVDIYKVGHHGSRNATPKTLWGLFEKKMKANKPTRLKTFMSTMIGKHASCTQFGAGGPVTLVSRICGSRS